MQFDQQAIIEALPYLTKGLLNTILLCFLGIVLSSALGIICAVLRISRKPLIRGFLVIYVEIFHFFPKEFFIWITLISLQG